MKTLSVVGTAAMFLVGGGILTHGMPGAHDLIHGLAHHTAAVPGIGGLLEAITPTLLNTLAGMAAGAAVLAGTSIAARVLQATKRA